MCTSVMYNNRHYNFSVWNSKEGIVRASRYFFSMSHFFLYWFKFKYLNLVRLKPFSFILLVYIYFVRYYWISPRKVVKWNWKKGILNWHWRYLIPVDMGGLIPFFLLLLHHTKLIVDSRPVEFGLLTVTSSQRKIIFFTYW